MAGLLVVPDLLIALGLLLFAARSGWFPTGGLASVGIESLSPLDKLRDLALHMILPVVVLVLTALPLVVRHVRAAMAGVLTRRFCEQLEVTESDVTGFYIDMRCPRRRIR